VLEVSLRARVPSAWCPAGHEVAWGQFALPSAGGPQGGPSSGGPASGAPASGAAASAPAVGRTAPSAAPSVTDDGGEIVVRSGGLVARVAAGWLTSWSADGYEIVDVAPRLELWRALVDNDRGGPFVAAIGDDWARAGLDRLQHRVDAVEAGRWAGGVRVVVDTTVAPPVLGWRARCRYVYSWDDRGRLAVLVGGHLEGEAPGTFARIGLSMALAPGVRQFSWYGLGPQETYPDTEDAGRLGRYHAALEDLQTPYVVPQENGQRSGARWALASDGHRGLLVAGDPHFGFSAHPWSTAALDAARHRDELVPEPRTWLHLDHRQHGLGSATCGPGPLDAYVLKSGPFHFGVGLWPVAPLPLDPGPAARRLAQFVAEAAATPS
jgi:hypothetical protein